MGDKRTSRSKELINNKIKNLHKGVPSQEGLDQADAGTQLPTKGATLSRSLSDKDNAAKEAAMRRRSSTNLKKTNSSHSHSYQNVTKGGAHRTSNQAIHQTIQKMPSQKEVAATRRTGPQPHKKSEEGPAAAL